MGNTRVCRTAYNRKITPLELLIGGRIEELIKLKNSILSDGVSQLLEKEKLKGIEDLLSFNRHLLGIILVKSHIKK